MKLARHDLVAALQLRYDHYSSQSLFEAACKRANLSDQEHYTATEIKAFRQALSTIGDRLQRVDDRLDSLLGEAGATTQAPATASSPEPAAAQPPMPVVDNPKVTTPSPAAMPAQLPVDDAPMTDAAMPAQAPQATAPKPIGDASKWPSRIACRSAATTPASSAANGSTDAGIEPAPVASKISARAKSFEARSNASPSRFQLGSVEAGAHGASSPSQRSTLSAPNVRGPTKLW